MRAWHRRGVIGHETAPRATVRLRLAAAAALPLVLAACGSSSSSSAASISTPPSPAATSANPEVVAGVTGAYEQFFDPKSTDQQVRDAVQNGQKLADAVSQADHSSYQGHAGVKVTDVEMQSPIVAKVTFTVTLDDKPILPNASGYAVLDGGTWKMAATTFCQLLQVEGDAPALCADASATAFPTS
jgi:hypothetical protein